MHAKTVFCIAILSMVSSSFAASPAEQITDINTDIAVLDAQVKRDDLRLRNMKQRADIEKINGGASSDLQVVWVEGIGKQKYAQLITEAGNRYEVRAGDKLPQGLRVVSVAPNEVVVEDSAKRRRMLTMAPASASNSNAIGSPMSSSGGAAPVPTMMPGVK